MVALAKRGSGTPTTNGTTWASTTNAVDGTAGSNPATYTTYTNATASAVGYIEISGYDFASTIGASDTLNSVTVNLRHFENNTGRFASVRFQPYDGATAIGTIFTATLATAARNDSTTFPVTLAQIRSSTFKIRVTVTGAASTQSRVESIDYVDVTADYTPLPPAITQAAYQFYADTPGTPELVDSYDETNGDASIVVGETGAAIRQGQSFLGTGKPLFQAGFYMARVGSPVGNVTATLYAHSATFGTTGTATGSPLATSTAKDAASLSTSLTWVAFDFDGTVTLTNGTPYVIVVEASNLGTNANSLRVRRDGSSPTHAGNACTYVSTWNATGGVDLMFRVYANPSNEATSTALAAQDTAYTADTSSGDVNLQVRVRLQSTNAAPPVATDDWQLQWEKNTSGTWNNVTADLLADGYPDTNNSLADAIWVTAGGTPSRGQTFLGNGQRLTRVGWWLASGGSPGTGLTGTLSADLYAHTGTFGLTGVPTGTALATATTTVNAAVLTTTLTWFYFDFDRSLTLTNSTPYVVVLTVTGGNSDDFQRYVRVSTDNTSPTHPGNAVRFISGAWGAQSGVDTIFALYTGAAAAPTTVVPYASANLTDAAATTNRLGAGSGSFVAGKVSEDGLVDDLGWTANNYTELLYSITLKQADVANGDTLKFRVLRNGATTEMTYTQVPTISITEAAPAGGKFKWYNGSSWVEKPVKVWTGSAWVEKPLKVWTGSSWVLS